MALTKEEIAADLVWRYIEHVREPGGEPEALTRDELEQLVQLLETAGRMPEALAAGEIPGCRLAARARVERTISAAPEAPPGAASREGPGRSRLPSLPVPAWQFRTAMAAALVCGLAVATVGVWHRPLPQTVPIVRNVPDIDSMDEQTANQLLPRMVRDELDEREERSLMWHLLVCPGCYHHYVSLRRPGRTARSHGTVLIGW